MINIPWWLTLLLGLIPLPANLLWIKVAIEIAYTIWKALPWFHKKQALVELKKATKEAKIIENPIPIEEWSAKWEPKCRGIACPSDLVKE